MATKVDFYRHHLGEAEKNFFARALDSLFITTGPMCAQLEQEFAALVGAPHAVTMSNGTTALFLALKALGVGPGHEVVTTPMTFIATANAVLHAGATPVFADVEPDTGNLGLEAAAAAITPRTKAIIPVHYCGTMCDMRGFRELADRHGLSLIADCAHAVEARRDGLGSADLADAAMYSFYATKNLACGEGAAVTTPHAQVAECLKRLRMHGMTKGAADRHHGRYAHWDMTELGYKANLPDLLAALLLPQLPLVEQRWQRREAICRRYEAAFAALAGVGFPVVPAGGRGGRHLFTIWVDRRDEFLAGLQERGIGVTVNYRPVHLMDYYRRTMGFAGGEFPVAERIGERTITLPLYPLLTDDEVETVIAAVTDTARELGLA